MGLGCESPLGSPNSGLQEWSCSLRLDSSNSLFYPFFLCLEIWCQSPYWAMFPVVNTHLFLCVAHWFLTTPSSTGPSLSDWCHLFSLGYKPSPAFCNPLPNCSSIRNPSLCLLLTGISASPGPTFLFFLFITVMVPGRLAAKYQRIALSEETQCLYSLLAETHWTGISIVFQNIEKSSLSCLYCLFGLF